MRLDNHTRRLLRDPESRWAWIKYQFQLQGRTLAQVAHKAGVTRVCIYHAANKPYPRMEKLIADALGMEPKDLFPERYDQKTGLPHYRMGRPVGSKTKRRGKSVSKDSRRKAQRNVDDASDSGHAEAA